jgi:hypothetical protein
LETDSLTVELTPLKQLQKTSLPTPKRLSDDRESYHGSHRQQKHQNFSQKMGLLGLFVGRVLPAALAELRELETASGRLLVLRRRVIALFAIRTL